MSSQSEVFLSSSLYFSVVFIPLGHNKIPETGWLTRQTLMFSQFWRLRNTKSRYQMIQFLVRALFLASGWPTSCYTLTWPFLSHAERESKASSYKTTNPMIRRIRPTLMTSSKPNYLPKDPFQIPSHWGVKASTYELGEQKHSVQNTYPDHNSADLKLTLFCHPKVTHLLLQYTEASS